VKIKKSEKKRKEKKNNIANGFASSCHLLIAFSRVFTIWMFSLGILIDLF